MPTFVSAAARKLRTAKPLRKVTSATVVEPDALLAEIGASRERGWYHTHGEGGDGADALAVSGWLGEECIAIAISGPSDRFESKREEYVAVLRDVAEKVFAPDA
ncbi:MULTISPECIES: IclR family transcriptional regulator domain-containing protein [Achromobacter]|uniref:IclR family transcriptional regulator domain-containing protein n=1 Tax=Achromobacter TaxID=222 RepID=UPI0020C64032|nr:MULTISPECIES: IclR family transcriptional regulator C-terminal domain-containing protein [Achromobacter]